MSLTVVMTENARNAGVFCAAIVLTGVTRAGKLADIPFVMNALRIF